MARLLCPQLFLCYRFSWLFAIFLWNLSFPSTVFQFTNFNCLTRSNSKSISGLLCVAFLYCPISTLWFLSHTVSFDSDFFLNLFVLSGRWIQVDFFEVKAVSYTLRVSSSIIPCYNFLLRSCKSLIASYLCLDWSEAFFCIISASESLNFSLSMKSVENYGLGLGGNFFSLEVLPLGG